MANASHTPIPKEALASLSTVALTGLSNLLTERATSVKSKINVLDRKISLLRDNLNLALAGDKTLGPMHIELAALSTALAAGMSSEDVYTQGVPSIGIESVISSVSGVVGEDVVKISPSANLFSLQTEKGSVAVVLQYINADLDKIVAILRDRVSGKSLEPTLNYANIEASAGGAQLSQEDIAAIAEHKEFVSTKIVTPFRNSKAAVDSFKLQVAGKANIVESPYDLVFGPPVSVQGKYILSEDGLYYDSRGGGIPGNEVAAILYDTWKMNRAPNMGGKGIAYDAFDLLEYSNTVFSPEYKEVNDSVISLYATDDILQGIEDDRVAQVTRVSSQIADLTLSGYSASAAIVLNYRRSLAAISNSYEEEKRKRAKQLQLAGLFGGFVITTNEFPTGAGYILQKIRDERAAKYITPNLPSGWTIIGGNIAIIKGASVLVYDIIPRIPVNNFSFLNGTGIQPTIDTQKRGIMQSADVADIIRPYKVAYTISDKRQTIFLKDFTVAPPGTGDFVHVSGDGNVSGVEPFVKSLTDNIVMDGLEICYNFLKGVVTHPSSTSYNLDNEADSSPALNGKLVAVAASSVFTSGVGIPFLRGTLYNAEVSEGVEPWYADVPKGAYVRLPNNIKNGALNRGSIKIDDITYNDRGFSIESWLHIPNLVSNMDESHQFRILASCENTGDGGEMITATPNLNGARDYTKTHGLCIGYKLTDSYVSGTPSASSLEFGIFPTVSQNNRNGKWGPSVAIAETINGVDPFGSSKEKLGMYVAYSDATEDGRTILDCSSIFTHCVITFDYCTDLVSVFLDSKLVQSGAISSSFALNSGEPLQVPSPVNTSLVGGAGHILSHGISPPSYIESLHEGSLTPPIGIPILTPWIIGGGFTDSIGRSPSLEAIVGAATTPLGFMGSNTNDSYFSTSLNASGAVVGQLSPSIGGALYSGVDRKIPRSGLDGFVGSFKMYSKPLNTKEVLQNYNAQEGFFKNIQV